MLKKEIQIRSDVGLESKSAAMFIQKASNYKATIWIEKDERKANAKSLLGLLSLGVAGGMKVTLIADGDDEEIAIRELAEFAARGMKDIV